MCKISIPKSAMLHDTQRTAITRPLPSITMTYFAYTHENPPVTFTNCWLLTALRVPQERKSRPAVCLLHKAVELPKNVISAAEVTNNGYYRKITQAIPDKTGQPGIHPRFETCKSRATQEHSLAISVTKCSQAAPSH
jgi:hypothetical protein